MLVLSRRFGEKIIVGERELTITVVEIREGSVRIGIDAPRATPVYREEIYLARQRGEVPVKKEPE